MSITLIQFVFFSISIMSFSVLYKDANPHGIIVAISLPEADTPIPQNAWRQLRKEEYEYAQTLSNRRQITWIGGRIAAHTASNILNIDSGAILNDKRGAPIPKASDLTLSIAHKANIAVAIVAEKKYGTLGIDVETFTPPRMQIISKVLREEEKAAVTLLPPPQQWLSTLIRFSIKEALYKGLDPKQKRYISFMEASILPSQNTTAKITLHLEQEPLPKSAQAQYIWLESHIISTVRCIW
jgi:4'-phosphopantetheinyl transferase EntD